MKVTLALLFITIVVIIDAYPDGFLHRMTRGFKNSALQTARGFGKRSNLLETNENQLLSAPDLSSSERAVARASVLARLINDNEELADLIVKRLIDVNDDEVITADELLRRST